MTQKEKVVCAMCGTKDTIWKTHDMIEVYGKPYCEKCIVKVIDEEEKNIIFSTTCNLEGYKVVEYLGVESAEVVPGTGIFSEAFSGFSDTFGGRSTAFETKLSAARVQVFKMMTLIALKKGANAIIGIDLDYTEFSSNRVGVICNGTFVRVDKG